MSSSNTDSENSFDYADSDGCSVSEYDIAFEDGDLNDTRVTPSKSEESVDSLDQIYADEPMADEDWIKAYEKEQKENAKRERMLEERLNGTTRVDLRPFSSLCTIMPISSPADVTDQTRPTLLQTRR